MSKAQAGLPPEEDESPEIPGVSHPSPKHLKRSKVTAVACQPCQKRKSKCDGARPICSSCLQKGRADCMYDSAADLRRTSALKQRIDALQSENNDLRDIILSLCGACRSNNLEQVLRLTEQAFLGDDPSRIAELAQVLRSNPEPPPLSSDRFLQQDGLLGTTQFGPFQQMGYGYVGDHHQPMVPDGIQHATQTTHPQPNWTSRNEISSPGQEEDIVHQQRYPGAYMYQQ